MHHTCAHFCYIVVHCGIWDWCIVGFVQQVYTLTHRGLVMPYGDTDLGQLDAWWHQAITWTDVDFSLVWFCGIHLRTISQWVPDYYLRVIVLYNEFENHTFEITTTSPEELMNVTLWNNHARQTFSNTIQHVRGLRGHSRVKVGMEHMVTEPNRRFALTMCKWS